MTISLQREGEIFRATLEVLEQHYGRSIRREDLQEAVEQRLGFTEAERRIVRKHDQMPAWGMRFGWNLSAAKKVYWVDNPDIGWWVISQDGSRALRDYPGDRLFAELRRQSPPATNRRTRTTPSAIEPQDMLARLSRGPRPQTKPNE